MIFSFSLSKLTGAGIHATDKVIEQLKKACSFRVITDICQRLYVVNNILEWGIIN